MKMQTKKIKVSVIIVNFNNAIYLAQSINSILSQTYKFIEIIVVDDKSTDNSLKILKKFNNKILIVKNKKKTPHGSYNQINSYYNGFLKSKGEILFFLDSDDYFKKNKIETIVKEFKKKKNLDLIFDLPILKFKNYVIKNKFKQKKFILSSWPRFTPQSCIALKKKYASKVFNILKIKKFNSIWFDFRIATYYFLKNKNIYILNKYLTYYRQLEDSASKNYKPLSRNWWYRRNQAHDLVTYFSNRLMVNDRMTLDKIITKILYFFLKWIKF